MRTDANISETEALKSTEGVPRRSDQEPKLARFGYTYFIQVGGSVKVASATKIKSRLTAERKRHKKAVKVLAIVPAALADPANVRQLFAGLVTRYGWMRADRELLYFIDQLKAEGGVAEPEPPSQPPPLTAFDHARRQLYGLRKGRPAGDPLARCAHNFLEQIDNFEAAESEEQKRQLKLAMGKSEKWLRQLTAAA